jgi:signal transduction histidine kinase/ActR/RegA family two-component response regulator
MAQGASAAASTDLELASWRGRWASAVALIAAIGLVVLLGLVTTARQDRDAALKLERNTYEAMQLARSVDLSIARAEAAMGRYVLDANQQSASQYYQEWRLAARQIAQLRALPLDEPQLQRVDELRRLFNLRGQELSVAAAASKRRDGLTGIGLFYRAAQSPTLPQLTAQLEAIVRAGRQTLQERVTGTEVVAEQTDRLTRWLGWLALLISAMAIALSYWAYRAFNEGRIARSEADSEAERADELEHAVIDRTRELSEALERLRSESFEREAAEEKLRQIQKMEAVGALTGGIAHDFNNMLAVVVGGLDLARRKLKRAPREADQHLENAMEGATRAAALTRRLLAFARSEPLLPEAIAPAALVQGMLELIDRTIGERIRVHTTTAREDWPVWADPTGLENAVLNLCVNARDAMPEGGDLRIEVDNVTLAAAEVGALEAGEYVRIIVTDTGAGIAPEHLERVFEPFFTTKPVGKGTGLGLSQIFGFARQSGGDVTIGSEIGRGTHVAIYLPRARDVAERPAGSIARSQQEAEAEQRHGGAARILVVEDDPRVSRSTVNALAELGHEPVAVASGRAALDRLAEDPGFHLMITDVVMPEMTGIELAQEVAARHPAIRILFVTGYVGEAGSVDELFGAELLRKPFTVAQLATAVEQALPPPTPFEAAAE